MKNPLLISFPNSETHSFVHLGSIPEGTVCWSFSMEKNTGEKWEILLSWVNQEVHKVALAIYTSEDLARKDMNAVMRFIRKNSREQGTRNYERMEQSFNENFEREEEAS